jgi:spermidine synthase
MTSSEAQSSAPVNTTARSLLLLFFFASGCAALVYQIVWFQMLSLIIGSSSVSMGVLLGTFMGGMCLGSLFLPKLVAKSAHPLKVYAVLEGLIGVCGLAVLFALPIVGDAYIAVAVKGMNGVVVRGFVAGLCLLPPTLLMGATLPAISRWVETTPKGVSWLGLFYGGNTVGAVTGCVLAGFYLLRVYDVSIATYWAVVINLVVAALAWMLASSTPYHPAPEASAATAAEPGAAPVTTGRDLWPVYVTIGLSGLTALAAEVLWTRLLSLMIGQTVYTFSLILACFLTGLALGSSGGSALARSVRNPLRALAWCQFLLLFCFGWAAVSMLKWLPFWPINPANVIQPEGWNLPIFQFQLDIVRALWVVVPGAILWGASFPLALAACADGRKDPGKMVGSVYAANTVGAIFGAIVAAMILIPTYGTMISQRAVIGVVALSAIIGFVFTRRPGGGNEFKPANAGYAALTLGAALWMASIIPPVPALLIGHGHNAANRYYDHARFLFTGEGVNSSMAVSEVAPGIRNYHNGGKVQASSEPQDMRLQRMLGHMTTMLPRNAAKKMLVIGCGAGVTAGAVSIGPTVEHETIAEIEKLVPQFVARNFGFANYNVVDNPKVHVHIDDARHYLLSTDEKFDAITSDPFDPWIKGAATLYTKEFWEIAKGHLNPGGVITVFVQLYENNEAAVKSEVKTFLEVFPNGAIFSNTYNGAGYDTVMVGSAEPLQIDLDEMEAKLNSPEWFQVKQSLAEIGFNSAVELFATYAGNKETFKEWLADGEINMDRNLRLQYLAGASPNAYVQGQIHRNMVKERRYPEGVFSGSADKLAEIRARILSGAWW